MKKLLFVAMLSFSGMIWAQSPQALSYQCSVRDNSGELMVNQSVGVKIAILQGSSSGTVVYEEHI